MAPAYVICHGGQDLELTCMTVYLCGACGAPLNVGGSWSLSTQVLDRECVVVAEHLQACPALAGYG